MQCKIITVALGMFIGLASAHLGGPNIAAHTGRTLIPGRMDTLIWTVPIKHEGTAIALSIDGKTWVNQTTTNLLGSATRYIWTVPNIATTTARIRVCQWKGTTSANYCTDANNSTDSSGTGPNSKGGQIYTLVSGNFTIQGTSALLHNEALNEFAESIHANKGNPNVDVIYTLSSSEKVIFQALDLQGKILTTWLDGPQEKGKYHYSFFSNAVDIHQTILLKLQLGNKVTSQVWNNLP